MGGIADAINSLLQVIQGQQKILESAVSNNPSTIKRGRKKKQDETTDSGGVAEEGGGGREVVLLQEGVVPFPSRKSRASTSSTVAANIVFDAVITNHPVVV